LEIRSGPLSLKKLEVLKIGKSGTKQALFKLTMK